MSAGRLRRELGLAPSAYKAVGYWIEKAETWRERYAALSSWSYTSANGDTITLDHKPKRIIASAAEAGGLMAYGIKPVGIFVAKDLQ